MHLINIFLYSTDHLFFADFQPEELIVELQLNPNPTSNKTGPMRSMTVMFVRSVAWYP